MSGRWAWMLAAAGIVLWTASASAQCTKDTDCKGDRICEAGKCTSPPAPNTTAAAPPPAAAPAPDAGPPSAPPEASSEAPVAPAASPSDSADAALSTGSSPPPALRVAPATPAVSMDPTPVGDAGTPSRDERRVQRRSRAAMVSGIVMVSVGPIALLGALAAANAQEACDEDLASDYPGRVLPPSERHRVDACNSYSVPLYLLGISGAVLTAAGIPLIIYGGKSVPNAAAKAKLLVLPWAGRDSGGVRLRLDL